MSIQFFAMPTFGKLAPIDDAGIYQMSRIRTNRPVLVTATYPRNYAHLQKYFAFLNICFQNQEAYKSLDLMRTDFTKASGWSERHYNVFTQQEEDTAKSIKFAKMGQPEFNDFYDANIALACKYVLPGVTDAELRAELEGFQ